MPPLHKHTHKRNPFHIQKERWWGPSIYSPLPSTGLQMQQEIGLHMWPQLMLWDALTDWSESSPLSDSRVYALRFQHTDSIAFLSHCAYMGESGQYWFGEWMRSVGIYGEFIYQCLFSMASTSLKNSWWSDSLAELNSMIHGLLDVAENYWLCICTENKGASEFSLFSAIL